MRNDKTKDKRSVTIICKKRKKERADQADELEKTINTLERTLEHKNIEGQLSNKRRYFEVAEPLVQRGEKNTKYFLNLEKRHYKQGTISQLRINNDNFITKDSETLKECLSFYKNLYTIKLTDGQDPSIKQFFFPEVGDVHLSKAEETSREGPLTETECLPSLKQMADSKTPGTDCLPAKFYILFWSDISDALISALNFSYDTGKLPITQRRGLIKLIPKKETDLRNLKHWRPLSLLNCHYKIAAKLIAIRIQNTLPKLINNDQTGFIKGRFIGENIRLIDSIINYTANENIPGLILLLDFEKAFDTLEWPFIENTLQHYGFGLSIQKWIRTLYCDIESCIINNGWMSDCFKIERGVRQGCPLSPHLFVLSVEVLANAIRRDPGIKGISITQNEIKLSQYVDDITLIIDGSQDTLETFLDVIEKFSKISGLRINNKKKPKRYG